MNSILHTEDTLHKVEWKSAPPLWEVPRFETGIVTVANTAAALQQLPATTDFSTVAVEEFWAKFVALAATDFPGAIRAVQGASELTRSGTIAAWAQDPLNYQAANPLRGTVSFARDQQILENAGLIPCLLSTPSFVDLSINFADFALRVDDYRYANVPVLVTDLYLAMLRIDFRNTEWSEIEECAQGRDIEVRVNSETSIWVNIAELCRSFQAEAVFATTEAFGVDTANEPFAVFVRHCLGVAVEDVPLVDDASDTILVWKQNGCDQSVGQFAEQVSYRRHLLSPETLINVLAIQRMTAKGPVPFARQALVDAWNRGLIDPWRVDISYLDWSARLEKIPSFVAALVEIADEGLLALAWQTLDELLAFAADYDGRKIGILEVVRAVEQLLPKVRQGVADAVAPESALELRGLRAFAALTGRSKAVVEARKLVETLGSATGDAES